jgi:glycopeptide antibiotics resistance protein
LGKDYSFTYIPYTSTLIGIAVINWFIPTLHCLFRNLFDYGIKIDDFLSYFRNNSILFLTFYIGFMMYGSFLTNAFPWAYTSNPEAVNFTPFLVISTQIEDFLYERIPLSDIIVYLSSRIFIFIPYGFYCTLFLRRQSRLLRFFLLLLLPVTLEILQYFLYPTRFDIDDVIYALIGGIFGSLIFYLMNVIFLAVSGKEFLAKDTIYRFSNSSLHF